MGRSKEMIRKIIHIDEEKCNGCGACAKACHEGAIEMVNGKAKLMRDDFCDGFGDCLPNCPTGAITFTEREADAYDKDAVEQHKMQKLMNGMNNAGAGHHCPGSMSMTLHPVSQQEHTDESPAETASVQQPSRLMQW